MKKKVLKVLSLACAIAVIVSLCPCIYAGAEDAAAVTLDDLTAEKLAIAKNVTAKDGGNQIPDSIVTDLTLPSDSTITWASSNTAVIAADGTVTRPKYKDTVVTLTATQGEEKKEFVFTVKSEKTNMIFQDSFASYGVGTENQNQFIATTGTTYPWRATAVGNSAVEKGNTDLNKNVYFDLNKTSGSVSAYKILQLLTTDAGKANLNIVGKRIVVEFDSKITPSVGNIGVRVGLEYESESTSITSRGLVLMAYKKDSSTGKVDAGLQTKNTDGANVFVTADNVGNYNHFKFEINATDKTFTVNDNSTKISFLGQMNGYQNTDVYKKLTYLQFFNLGGNTGADPLYVDNVRVSIVDDYDYDYKLGTLDTDADGKITVPVEKLTDEAENLSLITVLYDENNKLIKTDIKSVTESTTVTTDIAPNTEAAQTVRAFLWNNTSALKPMCPAAEKNFTATTE